MELPNGPKGAALQNEQPCPGTGNAGWKLMRPALFQEVADHLTHQFSRFLEYCRYQKGRYDQRQSLYR